MSTTPTATIQQWLDDFAAAVARGDHAATTAMFGDESYWRDLISFTWNLKTAEGPAQIRAMLEGTMGTARPSNWRIQGEGSEANGVTEARFTFETATGRGRGQLRLIGGKAWTLLTTLQELKGFEEQRGPRRPKGVEHGVHPGRKTWLESYTQLMELNYWASTECQGARWDEAKQEWAVTVQHKGETVVLRPKHLVFATGMSGVPNLPSYPGMDSFRGTQLHSSKFGSGEAWKGKKAVVVGSSNSASTWTPRT